MSPLFSAALGLPPQRGDGWHKTSRNRNRKGQGGGVKMWLVVWNIFYLGFNNDKPTISILFQYYIYIYIIHILYQLLVGGLVAINLLFSLKYWEWNVIIPIDEQTNFSEGWRKTTNQLKF